MIFKTQEIELVYGIFRKSIQDYSCNNIIKINKINIYQIKYMLNDDINNNDISFIEKSCSTFSLFAHIIWYLKCTT